MDWRDDNNDGADDNMLSVTTALNIQHTCLL